MALNELFLVVSNIIILVNISVLSRKHNTKKIKLGNSLLTDY